MAEKEDKTHKVKQSQGCPAMLVTKPGIGWQRSVDNMRWRTFMLTFTSCLSCFLLPFLNSMGGLHQRTFSIAIEAMI